MFWIWGIYNWFIKWEGPLYRLAFRISPEGERDLLIFGLGFLVLAAAAYLLGSVNFALVISRLFYHDDIRTHGSGNAGTTNVLRTYGGGAALGTALGDGLKGVVSILLACLLFAGTGILLITAAYLAAFCCVLGHIFPCLAHFRGGKGFATTAFCIIALNPMIALVLCFVFFPLVLGTHYVSLGSIITAMMYSLLLGSFDAVFSQYGVSTFFAFLIGLLVLWSHRSNVVRLLRHEESKTYFFRKKTAPAPEKPASGEEKDGRK